MNISSAVVKVLPHHENNVVKILNESNLCEVHLHEAGKIVITIEGESINDEISAIRQIERLQYVLSAEMIYSYSEDEMDEIRENVEMSKDVPEILNNDQVDAKHIVYNGDIKKIP